jgi:TniQ
VKQGRAFQQLLFRPTPLEGEAVCSWLFRIAVSNGHRAASSLIKLARLDQNISLSAAELTEEMKAWLSAATGHSQHEISECLKDAVGDALGAAPRRTSRRWLLRNSQRRVGQRFSLCQHCLARDPPYWRGTWRFALTVRCAVHNTALIDRCPACLAPQLLSVRRECRLNQCEDCGASLATITQAIQLSNLDTSDHTERRQIWRFPGAIELAELPVEVPFEHLFWDGIWTILSHVLLRQVAQRLQTADVPAAAQSLLSKVADSTRRVAFEELTISDREVMLEFGWWLCEDWPTRFVEVFKTGRVLAWTFSVREVGRPYWIDCVVSEHLNKRLYRPSEEEVRSAAAWLAKQQGASQPSRLRLKQTLGISESIQIPKVLQLDRRAFTMRDLDLLLRALQDEIDSAETRRSCRDSVVRDALVIAMCVLSSEGISKVCRLTPDLATTLWGAQESRSMFKALTWGCVCEWRREYENTIRPLWLNKKNEQSFYFLTRHGMAYLGFGLPGLFRRCLKSVGYGADWRGVGVLRDLRVAEAAKLFDMPELAAN